MPYYLANKIERRRKTKCRIWIFFPPIITLVKLKLAIKNIQPTHSKLENFIKQSISHQTPEMNTIRFKILVSFLPQHFPSNQTLSLSERKRRKMKVQERESRQGKKKSTQRSIRRPQASWTPCTSNQIPKIASTIYINSFVNQKTYRKKWKKSKWIFE